MSQGFSPALEAALDKYDVPELPAGFADRLVARAQAEAAVERQPKPRRRSSSPWKRAGRIIGSLGAIGFVSATAAAMGFFGEPIEVPVISDVARELALIEPTQPIAKASAAPAPVVAAAIEAEPGDEAIAPLESAARQRLGKMVEDPRFQQLTPRQKRIAVRRASRQMVRTGDASREDIRNAVRDIRVEKRADRMQQRLRNATPEQKARMRERFESLPPERQEAIRERLQQVTDQNATKASSSELAVVAAKGDVASVPASENISPSMADADPAAMGQEKQMVPPTDQAIAAPLSPADRRAQLRERFDNATPEQRAIMRERLQQRRKQLRDRRTKLRQFRN